MSNRTLYRYDDKSDEVSILESTTLYGWPQRYV